MSTVVLTGNEGQLLIHFAGVGTYRAAYGQTIRIRKRQMPHLPKGLRRAVWSLPLGERAAYRDSDHRNSIHIREFDDYWDCHVDHFNPDAGPVEFIAHGVVDAPAVTLGILGIFLIARGICA